VNYRATTLNENQNGFELMQVSDQTEPPDESGSGQSTSSGARMISIAGHKLDSRDLFIGTREVLIHHGGEVYRLRLTSQNKLILTK
jgi:hemin uptake protein HemP